ncbi:hypothetical protein BEI_2301 [Halomonas beimenensis]|uniref:Uncharacterized protein n=1 Tax=Halomonas beimenensis TaxID=475662 RepID=A0A291P8V4_9GAMM|nr:hypothetical protein BEI_2301 [Halomonas beimenensis]
MPPAWQMDTSPATGRVAGVATLSITIEQEGLPDIPWGQRDALRSNRSLPWRRGIGIVPGVRQVLDRTPSQAPRAPAVVAPSVLPQR